MSKFATANTKAIVDRYGVRKPMLRDKDISKVPGQSRLIEDAPERFAVLIALTKKIPATEIRKSSNARPGPPCGNIENNLCTSMSVATSKRAEYPK